MAAADGQERDVAGASSEVRKSPEATKRVCILVLGMHRSGTSALTRVISLLGAALPNELMGPGPGNEAGHWEPARLVQYHDQLLADRGSRWDDWRRLEFDRVPSRRQAEIRADIRGHILADYQDAPLVVLKEPRICRFAPLFLQALDEADYDTRIIIPFRNPIEVIGSLEHRTGVWADEHTRTTAALLWLRHVLDAEVATRHRPRAILSYDSLLYDWRVSLSRCEINLGLSWPYTIDAVEPQITHFLSSERRNHRATTEDVRLDPALNAWVADAYEALLVQERAPATTAALATLDRIRRTFDDAAPVMERLVTEQLARADSAIASERNKAEAAVARERTRAEASELQLATVLQTMTAELTAARTEIERLEVTLSEARAKLDASAVELAGARETLAAELDASRAEATRISAALSEANTQHLALLVERDADRQNAHQKAEVLAANVADLTAELDASRAEATRISAALSEANTQHLALLVERDADRQNAHQKAEVLAANVADLTAELAEKNEILRSRASDIDVLIEKNNRLDLALTTKIAELDSILASTSWRLLAGPRRIIISTRAARDKARFVTRVLSKATGQLVKQPGLARNLRASVTDHGLRYTWRRIVAKTMSSTTSNSFVSAPRSVQKALRQHSDDPRYDAWLRFNGVKEEQVARLRIELAAREGRLPTISVLMPVYNAPTEYLDAAIESVLHQVYTNWQLCIVDDASTQDATRRRLDYWREQDERICCERLSQNQNISGATNFAAKMATGEFLAFLDQDDLLTADALAEIAIAIADDPNADYLYSDDDKMDATGGRYAPQFKPDWSPVLLLSFMYMGHIKVVRRSLYEELGGFRKGFEGSQDYDFALRMSELARKIVHVPKVLYHWRATPGSTADAGDAKPASFEAGRKAVEEALLRRGFPAKVARPDWAVRSKNGVFEPQFTDTGPSVAIIIPTKNRHDLLRACINSLKQTTYTNYRVYVVDNESNDPATIAYLNSGEFNVLHIANPPGRGFSYAHINNEAIRRVESDYVLLLNNDTEVRAPRWLSQMVGYAAMPGVGAVGARLLFGDETIQHAGIAHGYYSGMAGPTFRNLPSWNQGYMGLANVARECSAVTAACLLVKRSLYLEHGGLDEQNFAVAYNDVDFCYRLVDAGYSCIYCPGAELFHFEGKSRGHADNPREMAAFRRRYALRSDPWLSKNLSRDNEHFEVRPYHLPVRDNRAVRVAMFTHNLNLEGAPNSLLEMVSGLKENRTIDPVILSPSDGPLRAQYERRGIPVRIVQSPLADVHETTTLTGRLQQLAGLYRELGTEVVYGNTLQTFWAIKAADLTNLPSVWNVRESEPWQTYFDWLPQDIRGIAYDCFRLPYRVVFVASTTRQAWAPVESAYNFTVVPNGLDTARLEDGLTHANRAAIRRELNIGDGDVAAVLVGTVCERKGQQDFVEALHILEAGVASRIRALIVGDRDSLYSQQMHALAQQLPPTLRQRLTIFAETRDVPKFLKAADIALCTSRVESYPRVILEAMAAGLPIITTPVFGISEQVRENLNALFYEPGNAPALAHALSRLVQDDSLRARMSAASRPVLEGLVAYPEMLYRYGEIFREARESIGHPWQATAQEL